MTGPSWSCGAAGKRASVSPPKKTGHGGGQGTGNGGRSARLGVGREGGTRQQNHFIENQLPTNPRRKVLRPRCPPGPEAAARGPGQNEGLERTGQRLSAEKSGDRSSSGKRAFGRIYSLSKRPWCLGDKTGASGLDCSRLPPGREFVKTLWTAAAIAHSREGPKPALTPSWERCV